MKTKVKDLSLSGALALSFFGFAAVPVHILSDVYVLRYLWGLGIEPTFHVPMPSGLTMYMLVLFMSALLWKPTANNGHEPTLGESVSAIAMALFAPWSFWLMAKVAIWLMT